MLKKLILINILFCISLFSASQYTFKNRLVLGVAISSINGTSKEIVYDGSKTLSELTWRLEDVKLLDISATYLIDNKTTLNANFKYNTETPYSTMDDYDWLSDVRDDWTHWSHHPHTKVEEVKQLDINIQSTLQRSRKNILYAILGYKQDTFKWEAANYGDYTYTSVDNSACETDSSISCTYNNNFRDTSWSSTSETTGISYAQYFKGVYLGLGGINTSITDTVLNFQLKYSPIIYAEDTDTHHNRDLYFEEYFENVTMYEASLSAKYYLDIYNSIYFGFSYLKYELTRGNAYVTDLSTNIRYSNGDSGISHESSSYLIGFKHNF